MNGPCLIRMDVLNVPRGNLTSNRKENPTVIYLNRKKITVGRAHYADYRILSKRLSNIHLIINVENNPNEYVFKSSKSGKGTYVNNYKVKDEVHYLMKDGDVIRLGAEMNEPINVFVCRLQNTRIEKKTTASDSERTKAATISKDRIHFHENLALKKSLEAAMRREKVLHKELKRKTAQDVELKEKYKTLERGIERLMHEHGADIYRKQQELLAYKRVAKKSSDQLLATRNEKVALNVQLNELLVQQHKKDGDSIVEKRKMNLALQHSSVASRILQELVVSKCPPMSLETATGLAWFVTNVLKTELKCGLCSELVLEAVTLECSHMFCSHCIITEWNQMRYACPICSRPFAMHTKTLVLDGFIDNVLDLLSPKLKSRRLKMLSDRERNFKASGPLKTEADVGFDFSRKGPRDSSYSLVNDTLWSRLKGYINQLLQANEQQQQQQTVEVAQEAIVANDSKKLESALSNCSFASNVLQELVAASRGTEHPTCELAVVLTSVLEADLQCGICTELVIEALTLQCSHMFCSYCITEWAKIRNECPNCRQPVTMFTKTLALDGFVDKVLDLLSPQLKTSRLETITERELADSGHIWANARGCSYH